MKLTWLYYIFLCLFILSNDCSGQANNQKVDSLARAIDSSARALRKWQNRFKATQDSVYTARIKKPEGNTKQYIPANTYTEQDKHPNIGRYVVAGVLILLLILILAFRKYRGNPG